MEAITSEKRRELIEAVSEVDDKLAESFLNDEPISSADLEVCTQLVNLVYKEITTLLWSVSICYFSEVYIMFRTHVFLFQIVDFYILCTLGMQYVTYKYRISNFEPNLQALVIMSGMELKVTVSRCIA